MERNIKIEGITLKKLQLGENNIGVTILTEKDEVLFVMAYGALKPKSKLFSSVNPFVQSTWDLFFDPVKEYYRAKEAVVNNFNEGIQLDLEAFYTASLFLEVILKSQGCQGVYNLLTSAIYSLGLKAPPRSVLIQFILRLLEEQGLLPSFSTCSHCDREIQKDSMFLNRADELVCRNCVIDKNDLELNPGILLYCKNTPYKELNSALKVSLSKESTLTLKNYLIRIIKTFTGGKLLTLHSSNGLI